MSYPMPTVVGKGKVLVGLDDHYKNPERRRTSLARLRAGADIVASGQAGGLLTGPDIAHVTNHWFGPKAQNWWNVLVETAPGVWTNQPLSSGELAQARLTVRLGFIRALARSLGLTENDPVPGSLSDLNPALFRPVKVYWVCGKLDGIEVQVVESEAQIDLFIVTPPISSGVEGLCWGFTPAEVTQLDSEVESMVVVRLAPDGGGPGVSHVHMNDGGVAEGGAKICWEFPGVERIGPDIGFALGVRLDDCARVIGEIGSRDGGSSALAQSLREMVEKLAAAGEEPEFTGLNELVIDIHAVNVASDTLWASAKVRGKHVRVNRAPNAPQPTFLGWAPTGNEDVEFDLALLGTYTGLAVQTLRMLWDKQSVHGQLGVRAIGRPVPRKRTPS